MNDLPPQEPWAPGMAQGLDVLRQRLTDEGWRPVGHGHRPWSYRYTRPRLDESGADAINGQASRPGPD